MDWVDFFQYPFAWLLRGCVWNLWLYRFIVLWGNELGFESAFIAVLFEVDFIKGLLFVRHSRFAQLLNSLELRRRRAKSLTLIYRDMKWKKPYRWNGSPEAWKNTLSSTPLLLYLWAVPLFTVCYDKSVTSLSGIRDEISYQVLLAKRLRLILCPVLVWNWAVLLNYSFSVCSIVVIDSIV